jgi:hypothetical protein
LFEQLRREHEFGVGTIAGVAAKFGVHRRVVRRAIASALPPAQHYPERVKPMLGVVADFIDKVLDEDGKRRVSTVALRGLTWPSTLLGWHRADSFRAADCHQGFLDTPS